ncbi:hypothetical protein V1522DRAFT_395207 [Lipomyces starkeyi]
MAVVQDLEAHTQHGIDNNSATSLHEKISLDSPLDGSTACICPDEKSVADFDVEYDGHDDLEVPENTAADCEVKWDGHNDPENPQNRSKLRRWFIVCLVSTGTFCV